MTEIRIHNPVQAEFAMVPNVLWTWPGLSFKAKGFMAYLLSFRHGIAPAVAAMEAETGLGRDARKAAMAELVAAGLATWRVVRGPSGRVVAKFLEVSTVPLLAATLGKVVEPKASHTPENPSDGKSGGERRKIRRAAPENPAISRESEKDKSARGDAGRVAARSAAPRSATTRAATRREGEGAQAASLTAFQRARLLAGQSCLVHGVALVPGSASFEALRQDLRGEVAENGGRAYGT